MEGEESLVPGLKKIILTDFILMETLRVKDTETLVHLIIIFLILDLKRLIFQLN